MKRIARRRLLLPSWALAVGALAATGAAGCGSDDGSGEDAGTPDMGGPIISDIYDCDAPSVTSCDNIVCLTEVSRTAIELACNQPTAPEGCDGTVQGCFDEYLSCIRPACPPGTDFTAAEGEAIEVCADTFDGCTAPIVGD